MTGPYRPMPRLGHGGTWSTTVVTDIESDPSTGGPIGPHPDPVRAQLLAEHSVKPWHARPEPIGIRDEHAPLELDETPPPTPVVARAYEIAVAQTAPLADALDAAADAGSWLARAITRLRRTA